MSRASKPGGRLELRHEGGGTGSFRTTANNSAELGASNGT